MGWTALARTHLALGELEDAVVTAQKALSLNPHLARAEAVMGIGLWQLDRAQDALSAFDRALANSPQDSYRWIIRGSRAIALALLERFEDAIAEARQAQLDPKANYLAYVGEACALGHLRRTDEARQAIRRGLEADPEFGIPLILHDFALPNERVREFLLEGLKLAGFSN
ncbi:MAG: hypothetical protein AAGD43_32940 [Pseudomonadota bacterium]